MKTHDYYRTDYLKKIWLTLRQVKKIRETIDDIYYWLCNLWLYWDVYNTLQKMHWIIWDLLDDEHIDEDDLDDLYCFIENHCQYYL
jgi:hypothetical protein